MSIRSFQAGYAGNFSFARGTVLATFGNGVSGGVTVAQGPLEAFVMVRIHAGQPIPKPMKGAVTPVLICASLLLAIGCHTPSASRHHQALKTPATLTHHTLRFTSPLITALDLYQLSTERFSRLIKKTGNEESTTSPPEDAFKPLRDASERESTAMSNYRRESTSYLEGRRMSAPAYNPSSVAELMEIRQ